MELSKNVKEAYDNMILNSTECDELLKNYKYGQLQEQHSDIVKEISLLIPKEKQSLLQKLEGLEYDIRCIEQSILYKSGLRDGVQMLKILNVI